MYNPCFTCLDRFRHDYSSECDNKCEFAHVVKELKELKEKQLYMRQIKPCQEKNTDDFKYKFGIGIPGYDWISESLENKIKNEIKLQDGYELVFHERFIKVT